MHLNLLKQAKCCKHTVSALIQPTFVISNPNRDFHGNRKYMARMGRKPRTRNLFGPVERLHALKRGEQYKHRYTDKYGRRSDKFVPVHKLPAPRWSWDYDLTEESSLFLKQVNAANNKALDKDLIKLNPLKDKNWELGSWEPDSRRIGAIGIKLGVQRMWMKDGTAVSATLIQIKECNVLKYFSAEEYNGKYAAAIVGAKNATPYYRNEIYQNYCLDAGVPVKQKCFRFAITDNARLKPGTPISATHFTVGQHVDCLAKTIGYGFQGVIQRFHKRGGNASHGNSGWHRRIGSIADRSGHVWKTRTMPGQLGGTYETTRGLKIIRINYRHNVIYVKGQIPGHVNTFVKINDSTCFKYKPTSEEDIATMIGPFPTCVEDGKEFPEEVFSDDAFDFDDPSIVIEEKTT